MKYLFSFLITFFLIQKNFCQYITLRALNDKGLPLSLASITYFDKQHDFKGLICDDYGIINIDTLSIYDSVFISYQGYKTKKINKKYLFNNVEVILDTAIYELPSIKLSPYKIIGYVNMGIIQSRNSKDYLINFKRNYEAVSFLIPDTSCNYKIDKLYIGIKNVKKCPVNIEVKIFRLSDDLIPSDEIIEDKLILSTANTKSDLLTVDMNRFNILFPPYGIAVALQLIQISDCVVAKSSGLKILYQPKVQAWFYNSYKKKWSKSSLNQIEPMIGLSLQKIKI